MTRGVKRTPNQDPRFVIGGRTIGDGKPGVQTTRAGELYLRRVTAPLPPSVAPR